MRRRRSASTTPRRARSRPGCWRGCAGKPEIVAHDGRQATISEGLFAEESETFSTIRHLLQPRPGSSRPRRGAFDAAAASILRLRKRSGMICHSVCSSWSPVRKISPALTHRRSTSCAWNLSGESSHPPADGGLPSVACPGAPSGQRKTGGLRCGALLFSGDLDPVTPVRFGDEVVRSLRNGKHIVLKGNGHAMGSAAPCIATIMKEFIHSASVQRLNFACAVPE